MNLDGCIFGWLLFKDINLPIAYHTGIIVTWNRDTPLDSIVAHYGSEGYMSKVRVERLRDAAYRSNVKCVKINPYYNASFPMDPYHIDISGNIHMNDIFLQYEIEHPEYDIVSCNCQHFVRHFVGNIPLESDMFNNMQSICKNIIHASIFGSKNSMKNILENTISSYQNHRSQGICAWEESLDIHV